MRRWLLRRRLKDALRYRLYRQNWTIGVVRCPIAKVAGLCGRNAQRRALEAVHWMREERGLFRADPFPMPLERDEATIRILFEQLRWSEGRGTIAACTYDGHDYGPVELVLDQPHHLSYPFTLEHKGEWLMAPEQAEAGCVRLYDASHGRGDLGLVIDGTPLIDPTIFEHDGRWWMFATHAGASENAQLHLYHARNLAGPWTAHRANPVKSDLGSARPAGHVFRHEGGLYRPGQNCTDYYGQGIAVHRIVKLDEEAFEEEQVAAVEPPSGSRYRDGLHTIASCGPYTVIDGARLESVVHSLLDGFSTLVR